MKNVEDTLTTSRLAQLEVDFLTHFEGLFWEMKEIKLPETKTKIALTHRNVEQSAVSEREKIKQLVMNYNLTTTNFSEFPLNRSMSFTIYQKKIFGKKTPVMRITASVIIDLETMFEEGKVTEPLDSTILENSIANLTDQNEMFSYIGIFSPTGWTEAAKLSVQESQDYKFILIEAVGQGFNIVNPLDNSEINRLFDPENPQIKQNRAMNYLHNLSELQAADQVVLIKDISEKCKIPEALVLQSAKELAQQNKSFKVEFISKSWVIYRVGTNLK